MSLEAQWAAEMAKVMGGKGYINICLEEIRSGVSFAPLYQSFTWDGKFISTLFIRIVENNFVCLYVFGPFDIFYDNP